eukprot:116935-Rhodomonas_salina.1
MVLLSYAVCGTELAYAYALCITELAYAPVSSYAVCVLSSRMAGQHWLVESTKAERRVLEVRAKLTALSRLCPE